MNRPIVSSAAVLLIGVLSFGTAASELTSNEAKEALGKAIRFFDQQVASEGGYLWLYAADLSVGEGEGRAERTTVWVQPPGTPTVGQAILSAFEQTGEEYFLDVARRAASALVRGQLVSGGWDYRIEFDAKDRARYAYRSDHRRDGRNMTTLDDDTTPAALRFLMRMDRTLKFQDTAIHDTVRHALDCLLKAQYPNGAWPQRYQEFPRPEDFPVKKASYPDRWSRDFPNHDYRTYYTLNDNTLADMIRTMLEAAEIYGQQDYGDAAKRAGDFLLLAQMPDPQPAWAQQYSADMHPAWARRFEPPAITGGESQGAIRILMDLYRQTGEAKYLEPIPHAIEYLQRSAISDGRVARFYELKTNRPLYFTRDYQLTYRDDDLPTHYAFQVGADLSGLRAAFTQLKTRGAMTKQESSSGRSASLRRTLAPAAHAAIRALDERGAWVEDGRLRATHHETTRVIRCQTFVRNVGVLGQFIKALAATPGQSSDD